MRRFTFPWTGPPPTQEELAEQRAERVAGLETVPGELHAQLEHLALDYQRAADDERFLLRKLVHGELDPIARILAAVARAVELGDSARLEEHADDAGRYLESGRERPPPPRLVAIGFSRRDAAEWLDDVVTMLLAENGLDKERNKVTTNEQAEAAADKIARELLDALLLATDVLREVLVDVPPFDPAEHRTSLAASIQETLLLFDPKDVQQSARKIVRVGLLQVGYPKSKAKSLYDYERKREKK
jgi:hypothetical protein